MKGGSDFQEKAYLLDTKGIIEIDGKGFAKRLPPLGRWPIRDMVFDGTRLWAAHENGISFFDFETSSWSAIPCWDAKEELPGRRKKAELRRRAAHRDDDEITYSRIVSRLALSEDGGIFGAFYEIHLEKGEKIFEDLDGLGVICIRDFEAGEIFFERLWDEGVDDIAAGPDGEIWVAGGRLFWVKTRDKLRATIGGTCEREIFSVVFDDSANLLFGTTRGIWKLDPRSQKANAAVDWRPLYGDGKAAHMVPHYKNVSENLHDSHWLHHVLSIDVDSEGRIWAGSLSEGLGVYEGSKWKKYQLFTHEHFGGPCIDFNDKCYEMDARFHGVTGGGGEISEIRKVLVDGRGRVWCASGSGLAVLDGNTWHGYPRSIAGVKFTRIGAIAFSDRGPADLPESTA